MIEVAHLTKRYGTNTVLNDVSFQVAPGRLTGFVGANGAGKTTTMRAMIGLVTPDSGEVLINGSPVTLKDRVRFGYMPEERGLYPKMKIADQVAYFGRLHGMTVDEAKRETARLLEELGLADRADKTLETLSLGNQQRVQLAATLVHNPDILILDEPFSGLDPLAVEVVLGVLTRFAEGGCPVVFSSHQLDVVERITDDLVIIGGGEIKASGSRAELQAQHSVGQWRLSASNLETLLSSDPTIEVLSRSGDTAIIRVGEDEQAQRLLRSAVQEGAEVTEFGRHLVQLSTVYKEMVA